MRIRGTKPEFWRSKRIASVSWDARLVLKALESYVDDNGVGEDDIGTIAGDCFLHDLIREPSRSLARVSEAISELHEAGLVWRYAHEGKDLVFVSFWESIQRVDKPLKGRNPRPDGTLNYGESSIREVVANPREASRTIAPVTGEQGNRGTEEQGGNRDETSPPTPFCRRHPEGTDAPCAGCKKARTEWDALHVPAKPVAPEYRNTTTYCDIHANYPMPCDKCRQIAEDEGHIE